MSRVQVTPIPLLKDNYAYLVQEGKRGLTAIVDPSEAIPVIEYLKRHALKLDYILNTHHHWDHTNGNTALKAQFDCKIIGFAGDKERIPGLDISLQDQEEFIFGETAFTVLYIPGHTIGHCAYYFSNEPLVFTGDTLFSMGCGRLFEGTPHHMWTSLKKLRALPAETQVYCGHEYTEANLRFALSLDPDNAALKAYQKKVQEQRRAGEPSVPSTMGLEAQLNPFLRADDPSFVKLLDLPSQDPISMFTEIRLRKDSF